MEGDDLDVQMVEAAVDIDVLDAGIRELHVPVDGREANVSRIASMTARKSRRTFAPASP